nr:plasma membrane proteolipid 3 [Quercus suber]
MHRHPPWAASSYEQIHTHARLPGYTTVLNCGRISVPYSYHHTYRLPTTSQNNIMCGSDIFLGFIAILFPPIAVWVKRGLCSADSLINIALCCLGFIPGLLHAWYIIAVTPDPTYEQVPQDPEGGHVTYYYVQQGQPQPRDPHGYGTVSDGRVAYKAVPNQQFPAPRQGQGFVQPPPPATQSQAAGPSSGDVPPAYTDVVQGDHKVQNP